VNNPEGAYVDNIVLREYASVTSATPPFMDTPSPPSGSPDIVDVPTMRVRVP
jgi:hypothetical protein